MRRVKLVLEYDGTGFFGWQRQSRTGERTVQGVLEQAFARLPGRHSSIHAAGRTDAGVHALAMVAHLDTDSTLADERLRLAINAHLPRDVVVLALETVSGDFESQFDCRYRRYLYRLRVMRDDPRGLALNRERLLPVFRQLDVEAMRRAARRLEGTFDFSAFATQETRSRVRSVYLCDLRLERGELRLHVAADGFLRNMVRCLVGTLLWVGKGKISDADLPAIIASKDRRRAGRNVSPRGLYFVEAGYRPWDAERSERAVAELPL